MEVDLALSAHANARRWYELKKKQESKQEKTVTAHEKAFKAAERKTRLQLSQVALPSMVSKLKIFIVVCKSIVLILYNIVFQHSLPGPFHGLHSTSK